MKLLTSGFITAMKRYHNLQVSSLKRVESYGNISSSARLHYLLQQQSSRFAAVSLLSIG